MYVLRLNTTSETPVLFVNPSLWFWLKSFEITIHFATTFGQSTTSWRVVSVLWSLNVCSKPNKDTALSHIVIAILITSQTREKNKNDARFNGGRRSKQNSEKKRKVSLGLLDFYWLLDSLYKSKVYIFVHLHANTRLVVVGRPVTSHICNQIMRLLSCLLFKCFLVAAKANWHWFERDRAHVHTVDAIGICLVGRWKVGSLRFLLANDRGKNLLRWNVQ